MATLFLNTSLGSVIIRNYKNFMQSTCKVGRAEELNPSKKCVSNPTCSLIPPSADWKRKHPKGKAEFEFTHNELNLSE